ncbi:PITH1-like protein, partial [Mya arenaria]
VIMSGHGHSHGSCEGDHDHVTEADRAAAFSFLLKVTVMRNYCSISRCVKLKGIILIGGEEDTHPNKMKVYKNRPNMTFDDTGCAPDQEFELHPDPSGVLEYSTKVTRFNQCESISLHFPTNFGAETTKVYYIGLKGDFTEAHRHEVTICTYETTPNAADHKTNLMDNVPHQIQ